MKPVRSAAFFLGLGLMSAPVLAQDIHAASFDIGQIERGFWTRPVANQMRIDDDTLLIERTYHTIVEWAERGIPSRSVTDTLQWRMPLTDLHIVTLRNEAGRVLLEGEDQDSYCPLVVAQVTCTSTTMDCATRPQFYTCRYNRDELADLLQSLRAYSPDMSIQSE